MLIRIVSMDKILRFTNPFYFIFLFLLSVSPCHWPLSRLLLKGGEGLLRCRTQSLCVLCTGKNMRPDSTFDEPEGHNLKQNVSNLFQIVLLCCGVFSVLINSLVC